MRSRARERKTADSCTGYDVGAGASTLALELLQLGYRDVTLLDVAEPALEVARRRLPHDDPRVSTVVADVTSWEPPRTFALWHDRAVFHFLTEEAQRDAYRRTLRAALVPGSRAILATFALDGPERCSGLPVRRYDAVTLAAELRSVLRPIESRHEVHRTPTGSPQSFLYTLFERV